jgi:ATP-dependent helicase/nuclease subunit A
MNALPPREQANRDQLAASDPTVSAFVGASAGSGKTKLLTDRLLRLMLAGAKPERIQCLTFTKAAAAEMALRLQHTLGRWVILAPDILAAELITRGVAPIEENCRKARELFAKVLDLPGGMRIGTIHAFCQSLLRRFPLEAELSPHFQLVDESDAQEALAEARETMLGNASTQAMRNALHTLAGLASTNQFSRLVEALQADRPRLKRAFDMGPLLQAAQRHAVGVTARTDAEVIENAVAWPGEDMLRRAAQAIQAHGSPSVAARSGEILGWLSLNDQERVENWRTWRSMFFTTANEPRAASGFANKRLADQRPDLLTPFLIEAERIDSVEDSLRALRVASVSTALVTLAGPVLRAYAERKDETGWLDYDDLIERSSALLVDPGAAWVLYKLDGGLDHLLLDEVQDTAAQQWDIAHALTEEFFAGAGARDTQRTVFAVGDRKQSIYSFQGANADEFDRARDRLGNRVRQAGSSWRDVGLNVSFRSTAPVLALVDRVFADSRTAAGVVDVGQPLTHRTDRADHAGSVELWPLTPVPATPPPEAWTVPDRNQGLHSAVQTLAETLAEWIATETSGTTMLQSQGRPLVPGDVMVLVRRRNALGQSLVRALKALGVPVAGLDRLVLTEQPAVQDLMALGQALLLPQDDLTFACLLTSPLGGLSDDDLMELAVKRTGPLWEMLRNRAGENPAWARARSLFETLLSRVDYTSPYALFAEALGPLGGRSRLFARLGAEAAEPVNEFLHAALRYGRMHPPSLQGFLHWLRRSGAEVKREPSSAGNQVRVMTVHGAKGLQAPMVILPDTTALPPNPASIVWAGDPLVPLWSPRKEFRCAATERIRMDSLRRETDEYNRLLYVALTRAEDRLVVCGWQTRRELDDACWYNAVARGFTGLPVERTPFRDWGEAQRYSTPQIAPRERVHASGTGEPEEPLPAWVGSTNGWRPVPPPPEPSRPLPLAPSRPEGVELGEIPAAASPLAARDTEGNRFRRGQLMHAMLQHLPALPAVDRAAAAHVYLDRPGHRLTADGAASLVQEVLAILAHPELAPLFGPGSQAEVPLTGLVGDYVVGGLVDRLTVLDDRVLLADFKTNRHPPALVADTPVMYLRQMASYRAVLRSIFPDRPVRCALVWTREARVAMLPDDLLDRHA